MQAAYKTAVHDGKKYITTQARGTEYTLMRNGDGWFVSSRRLALGGFNTGGGKIYKTIDEVKVGCKAFAALPITAAF